MTPLCVYFSLPLNLVLSPLLSTLQVSVGRDEHLQDLLACSTEGSLWQDASASSSSHTVASVSIAGLVPDWSKINLTAVGQLPTLLKLLAASGPAEAAGQLQPGSAVVLQWLGQHQVIEACLRHGIEGQGQLLRSVYDFCPKVLRVSNLLEDHRQNALLGKRLCQQPLQKVMEACGTVPLHQASSSDSATVVGAAAAGDSEVLKNSGRAPSALESEGAEPQNNPTLDQQAISSDKEGHLQVLTQLQHLEQWAFSQVSDVVSQELQHVVSALNSEGFLQRHSAVQALNAQWVHGCDELVEARRLGRRGILDKMLHQVCGIRYSFHMPCSKQYNCSLQTSLHQPCSNLHAFGIRLDCESIAFVFVQCGASCVLEELSLAVVCSLHCKNTAYAGATIACLALTGDKAKAMLLPSILHFGVALVYLTP